MSDGASKEQTYERFRRLDVSELQNLSDRPTVKKGLAYFRDYAVESLRWDESEGGIRATVSGSAVRPYRLMIRFTEDLPEIRCECLAWRRYGSCKHGVAAVAAILVAIQGENPGGRAIPDDYLQELRDGLELKGAPETDGDRSTQSLAQQETSFRVHEFGHFGSMRIRVIGDIPGEFLKKAGVTLPSTYAGGFSREFVLKNVESTLPGFLKRAEEAEIPVRMRTTMGEVSLQLEESPVVARLEFQTDGKRVTRRVRFWDFEDEEVMIDERPGPTLGLSPEGSVYSISIDYEPPLDGNDEKMVEAFKLHEFNRAAAASGLDWTDESEYAQPALRRNGVTELPKHVDDDQVDIGINGSIYKNAAGEPEALQYRCYSEFEGVEVDLDVLAKRILEPLLFSYSGGLLSSKRRVRALLDLMRRALAEYGKEPDEDLTPLIRAFPMFEEVAFRSIVFKIVEDVLGRIRQYEERSRALAVEPETGMYFTYAIPVRRLAMLLLSISNVDTKRSLHELIGGAVPIRRGSSGSEVLSTLLVAAKALGVEVRIDDQPVRRERLSISVDARASGHDIDWFALHPTIACGTQTIDQQEWWRLLHGDLLIQADDGSWIIPETGDGDSLGLRALADMMRVDIGRSKKSKEPMRVSRLQILDWIQLRSMGIKVALPEEAEALFQSLLSFDQLASFEPPEGLKADLRPYQKEGCAWIEFLFRHHFGACLADDMGLGKTVQAIAFIQHYLGHRSEGSSLSGAKVLIVLPPSLVFNWREEWARFAPSASVSECLKPSDWERVVGSVDIVLTTYDRVRLDLKKMRAQTFDIVVFDEAHNLKNLTAARTKAAAQLNRRFTLCLTGTPVENNASEFFSVMSAAVPGIFGNLKMFRETLREDPDRILARARPFILRRTKSEILKELPKKEEHVLHLEMTPLQKEIYTRTVAEVREEIAKAFVDKPEQQAGIVALAALLRLRQVCVSPTLLGKTLPEPTPKLAYLADKLEELKSEGHAALVFSQFIGGLDALEEIAKERGLDYLRMDGRTPMAAREQIVRRFQSKDGPEFFFVSLKTGGVGLNLTRANYVFHLDPWWNPAVENQATDRAHRIGQERNVFVQRLIMQHSIEARMMELKDRKAELFDQLVEQPGRQTAKAGLSRADFEYLLDA